VLNQVNKGTNSSSKLSEISDFRVTTVFFLENDKTLGEIEAIQSDRSFYRRLRKCLSVHQGLQPMYFAFPSRFLLKIFIDLIQLDAQNLQMLKLYILSLGGISANADFEDLEEELDDDDVEVSGGLQSYC
jgi:hypothetical protein